MCLDDQLHTRNPEKFSVDMSTQKCHRLTHVRRAMPYSTALTISSTTFFASPKTIMVLSM